MRIAFVGKGGAGKSTLSALMSLNIAQRTDRPVAVFDADLNIHIPELLGFDSIDREHHLSYPSVSEEIKRWLINQNPIEDLGAFRKTTPPTSRSNIIRLENFEETPLFRYSRNKGNIYALAVGTYQNEDIGASCYHNNLSVFENILSHTDDRNGYLVADMVAGVDAFSGTLHAQFDLNIFVVEPTKRSVEVCQRYLELSKEAKTDDEVSVVGNKIRSEEDIDFLTRNLPRDKVLGFFRDDRHLHSVDQGAESLSLGSLTEGNQELLDRIFAKLDSLPDSGQKRLEKLWSLHKKYVAQAFVRERFGDLSDQIDKDFSFDHDLEK